MAKSRRESLMSTLAGGHDFIIEYCCDLCEGDGNVKEAVGYCSDCKAYLCEECFKTHLIIKPFRDHQLLDQQHMPKDKPNRDISSLSSTLRGGSDYVYDNCCGFCEGEGRQKEAVGYCSDCKEYHCTDCFKDHTRPKPMRHHVPLDQHQMPKGKENSAQHVMDVRVRSSDDSKTPWITGCVVLSAVKLALVDNTNGKVKLVSLTRGDVVSQLEMSQGIWDITQVSSTQVAVTSPREQTIHFVKVGHSIFLGHKLKLNNEVKVSGRCHGIAVINDNLVVSFCNPAKVEIISMKGNVIKTVVTEDKGLELFTSPRHIAVSNNQQTIYVSDTKGHSVTSVDLEGKVQTTFRGYKLNEPSGLTVNTSGTVYVCGHISHNVTRLTWDLTEGRQLLKWSDGVRWPQSVCYCDATDRLYVGIAYSDVVKVFQMK